MHYFVSRLSLSNIFLSRLSLSRIMSGYALLCLPSFSKQHLVSASIASSSSFFFFPPHHFFSRRIRIWMRRLRLGLGLGRKGRLHLIPAPKSEGGFAFSFQYRCFKLGLVVVGYCFDVFSVFARGVLDVARCFRVCVGHALVCG